MIEQMKANKAIGEMKQDGTAYMIDRVNYGQECPTCGEDRIDGLQWDDDEVTAHCLKCGITYTPEVW